MSKGDNSLSSPLLQIHAFVLYMLLLANFAVDILSCQRFHE
jgi:hypothetical protein